MTKENESTGTHETFRFKGDFINGAYHPVKEGDVSSEMKCPADASDIIGVVESNYEHAEAAVYAAANAASKWSRVDVNERMRLCQRLLEILQNNDDQIVNMVSREIGKPLWESRLEFKQMLGKASHCIRDLEQGIKEFKVSEPVADLLEDSPSTQGYCRFKPRGVSLILAHYNLPVDNSLAKIFPALLTGNTVVYKPSKKAPAVGQLITDCVAAAGFPAGVFNLVQGGREMARRLVSPYEVDTILYAGDYEFGKQLRKDTFDHNKKLMLLETGGKNPAIVLDDANIDLALREILVSAYITTGQRADSISRVVLQEAIADKFIERLHDAAKEVVVGNPFDRDPEPFMGPLVDRKTLERYVTFQGIAVREGAECVMRGKALSLEQDGFYVSPSIYLFRSNDVRDIFKSIYQQTEIFGPSVAIHVVQSLEEAAAVANATKYGQACSVFCAKEQEFHQLWQDLRFGMIQWNRGTIHQSYSLPNFGVGHSHTALPFVRNAYSSAVYSVSSIECPDGALGSELPPGLKI